MTSRRNHDRETLLMMLSAYLDGELSAADESVVLDAMSQDPALLEAFEAMSAARLDGTSALGDPDGGLAGLSADDAADLTAGILAQTATAEMPSTPAGARQLANLFVDDAIDARGENRLNAILIEKPALAPAIAGFVASVEAVQQAAQAVAHVSSVVDGLRMVPDTVAAQVAARERLFVLASGDLDGALNDAEARELAGLTATPAFAHSDDARDVAAFAACLHVGEALRLTSTAAPFTAAAKRAGDAALHVIAAEAAQAAQAARADAPAATTTVQKPVEAEVRESFLAGLWRGFSLVRAPVALAAAAAAAFFVLSAPPASDKPVVADKAQERDDIVNIIAPKILADADSKPEGDLPVLADNSADVEALDATNATVVFSTESSNITVIWVGNDDDTQGT